MGSSPLLRYLLVQGRFCGSLQSLPPQPAAKRK